MSDEHKSMMPEDAAGREMFIEYIDESLDSLDGLDTLLIRFENNPGDLGAINAVFRPVHSIKGNSAFFGLMQIKKLAHELENLLDLLRKNQKRLEPALTAVLLKGFDTLHGIFRRVREGGAELTAPDELDTLLGEITAAAQKPELPISIWPKLVDKLDLMFLRMRREDAALVKEVETLLSQLRDSVPGLAATPERSGEEKRTNTPLRLLQRAVRDPLEGTDVDERARHVAEALTGLEEQHKDDEQAQALVTKARETFDTFMNTVGFDNLLVDLLREQADALSALEKPAHETAAPQAPEAEPRSTAIAREGTDAAPPAETAAQGTATRKTMRISEEQLDVFLAYVGELVVVGEMFNHLHAQLGRDERNRDSYNQFRYVNETFADLSNSLQRSIMALRRVSLKPLLDKAQRLVRDVAGQKGKEIEVRIEDNGLTVDKGIVDMLDAPLTHMVRNAADHGIETPAQREAGGKPRRGTIGVSAREDLDLLRIEIRDDGAGLDLDALKKKAISMGLLSGDREPTWNEITQVLFAPGVSTSKTVSDISGRGVGMDVVKRAVEEHGGFIDVQSTPGQGSVFTIVLKTSVTTQILPGFLVRVSDIVLVLPMEAVVETTQIEAESVTFVTGRGRCIQRHGRVLPLLDMACLLGLSSTRAEQADIVVVIAARNRRIALTVDELVGVQQVVVKPVVGMDGLMKGFAGGAIMGDGAIALVLDPESLRFQEDKEPHHGP